MGPYWGDHGWGPEARVETSSGPTTGGVVMLQLQTSKQWCDRACKINPGCGTTAAFLVNTLCVLSPLPSQRARIDLGPVLRLCFRPRG